MLDAFYDHVRSFQGTKYLHWNMRDINFGFAAIEHRHRVLGGDPVVVEDERKIDLSRLLIDIFGVGYIGHPRLESLLAKKSVRPLDFLTGAQEAVAFDFRGISLACINRHCARWTCWRISQTEAHDRHLKTSTTWWEMHGGRVRAASNWLVENKWIALAASAASIISLYLSALRRESSLAPIPNPR